MFVISVSYKNAPLEVRSCFVFSETRAEKFLEALHLSGIPEAVYLNTCNRCEVYGEGDMKTALTLLAEYSGVPAGSIKGYAFFYQDEGAIRHVFRVCAGLESMVVGEDEILGQMKGAYEVSRQLGHTAFQLNTIFQAAFASAKRIKTQTLLSKTSVSVATIAADRCRKFIPGEKCVLVIGASGDTGRKLVKNLLSYRDSKVYATFRSHRISEDQVIQIPYEERYRYMDEADVIVSATKSPHYTVVASALLQEHLRVKPRLFIDLAVPSDIDEDVLQLEGASLLTIDAIQACARKNNEMKVHEAELADKMVEEAASETVKQLLFHAFIPEMQRIGAALPGDFQRFIYQYRDAATAEEFRSLIGVLRRMTEADSAFLPFEKTKEG